MPTAPTLRSVLRARALAGAAFLVGFTVVALAAVVWPTVTVDDSGAPTSPPSRIEQLVEEHDCWTGQAPAGAVPSQAVVSLPGERAELVAADLGFGIWLEGEPGTLHAFCP